MPVMAGKEGIASRGKLGEGLGVYRSTPLNLKNATSTSIPEYNSLHDPHLRNFYKRKDLQKLLREKNLITERNEVKCSREAAIFNHRRLEQQMALSRRHFAETQKTIMMAFLYDQEKGLVRTDMTLSEFRELVLEQELQIMHTMMRSEVARERKYCKSQKPTSTEEEDNRRELELMSWKVEEREVLRRVQRDAQHEYNREKLRRETQERREKLKISINERKDALHQQQLKEKLKPSEASAARELAASRRAAKAPPVPTLLSRRAART